MPKYSKKKAVVWHPLVHQRFEEDLYFFLISVKPFDQTQTSKNLEELAAEFGIQRFCAYRILGQYDVLLRVWLPSARGPQFHDRAHEKIANLQAIIPFHVTSIRDQWRFKNNDFSLMLKQLSFLTPQAVKAVQQGDLQRKQALLDAGLIAEVDDYRKGKKNAIKAFVAISEPKWPDFRKRQQMLLGIIRIIEDDRRLQKVTVHSGLGFSWLLIKMISEDFYAFGEVVEKMAAEYGEDGVSTNTFMAATDTYVEGECISTVSLESREGDENVRLFIPELYAASGINPKMRDELERFISKNILTDGLIPNDQLAFQRYFKAVLSDNAVDAFTALYPKFVEAEQILREELLQYAGHHGGVAALLHELDPEKEVIKSAMTIPLSYCLRGCRNVLQKALVTDDWLSNLRENIFDELASFRNKIMHGTGFRAEHDWEKFAQAVLDLLRIKEKLLERFKLAKSAGKGQ